MAVVPFDGVQHQLIPATGFGHSRSAMSTLGTWPLRARVSGRHAGHQRCDTVVVADRAFTSSSRKGHASEVSALGPAAIDRLVAGQPSLLAWVQEPALRREVWRAQQGRRPIAKLVAARSRRHLRHFTPAQRHLIPVSGPLYHVDLDYSHYVLRLTQVDAEPQPPDRLPPSLPRPKRDVWIGVGAIDAIDWYRDIVIVRQSGLPGVAYMLRLAPGSRRHFGALHKQLRRWKPAL